MALQFNPYDEIRRRNEVEPDFNQTVTNPIMQGLQLMLQQKNQNATLDLARQKEAREAQQFKTEYGYDAPVAPRASFDPESGSVTPIDTRRILKPMSIDRSSSQRRILRDPRLSDIQGRLGLPEGYTPGTKHVAAYSDLIKAERDPSYVVPQMDARGQVTGFVPLPQGTKPAAAARPPAPQAGIGANGKMLPPPSVLALNEGKNVARLLPDVEKALMGNADRFGPLGGRAGQVNPYDTTAQTVDARMRTASQAFGRFMEGGVLRKEDEEKYRRMFPQLSDTPDVAKNKLSIVRNMLAEKYEDDRQTLGRSGYDVSGFDTLDIPPSIFDQQLGAGSIQPGHEEDGYRYIGGDPQQPTSWEPL